MPKRKSKPTPLRKTIEIDRWVSGWLYCFQLNADYKAYCAAKSAQNDALCKELEDKFPKIAQLYSDWGQIHGMDPSSCSAEFKPWYELRRHLFPKHAEVEWVSDAPSYTHKAGHLLIDVPLDAVKAETMDCLKRFIDEAYANRTSKAEGSIDAAEQLAYQPLSGPKYPLYGDLMNSSVGKLLKTIYVNDVVTEWNSSLPITNANIVRHAIRDPKSPFGWKMLQRERDAIDKGTFNKLSIAKSDLTLVRRCFDDFAALVRNTIHGRFPDYT